MDNFRFDHWTRSLSSSSSRRTISKFLASGALGLFLAHFGREEAEAKCVKPGKRCKTKKSKRTKCCGGARCQGKRCKCPGDREACGIRCCPDGQICASGVCVTGRGTCPPGADSCAIGSILCNNSQFCFCVQRLQGGTRCGQATSATLADQCATDADCLGLGFPAGSSCIRDDGELCQGTDPARGLCVVPCGFTGASSSVSDSGTLFRP